MSHKELIAYNEKLLKDYQYKPSEKELRNLRGELSFRYRFVKSREETAVFSVVRIITQQTNLTMDEVRLLMNTFKEYSSSKTVDGLLDKRRFELCTSKLLNASSFLSDQLFRVFDSRSESTIDFNDFVVGLAIFIGGNTQSKVELLFKIIDTDKNNRIEGHELRKIFKMVLDYSDHKTEELVMETLKSARSDSESAIPSGISLKEWKRIYETSPYLIQVFNFFMLTSLPREPWLD